jgi:hypothetical protein
MPPGWIEAPDLVGQTRSSSLPDRRPAIPAFGGIRGTRRSVMLVLTTGVLRIHCIAQANPPITANGIHAAWSSRAIRDWKTPEVSAAPTYHKLRIMRLGQDLRPTDADVAKLRDVKPE